MVRAVFIGDDFTGASDTLATFASAGWRTRLFLRAPTPAECEGLDAVGIATALRALSPEAALQVIADLWPAIAALDPQSIHYKVCSTFDSSPTIGSIGAVTNDLARRFSPEHLAVIGGQPNLGRHCVYGNLFARAADGVTYRIDRHPVMAQHPVTPMTEADLRLLLAAQGLDDLVLVARDGTPSLPLRALFDVLDGDDITRIAREISPLSGRRLLIGASSVAQVLTAATPGSGTPEPAAPPPNRRVLVFAGSRSSVTRAQVEAAEGFSKIRILPSDLANSWQTIATAAAALASDTPVLLHTDPELDYNMSPDHLALASGELLAKIVTTSPVGWLGIAGGDTSSRICGLLGFTAIDYLEAFSPGVGLCRARHDTPDLDGMRLILKGGQMGEADLFTRFRAAARS